jgi:hypothetical protein
VAVIFTTDPLECWIVSDCEPSSSTIRWPELVDTVILGAPDVVGLLRALRQLGPPVPGRAEDVRAPHVAGLERDHDLAPDLGQDLQTLVVIGVRRAQGRPRPDITVTVGAEPGEAHLDPAEPVRVDDVGDERRVDAEVAGGRAVGGCGK